MIFKIDQDYMISFDKKRFKFQYFGENYFSLFYDITKHIKFYNLGNQLNKKIR